MHQENKYKQMVVYVEACESGSMFDKLLSDNINGASTTVVFPTDSSPLGIHTPLLVFFNNSQSLENVKPPVVNVWLECIGLVLVTTTPPLLGTLPSILWLWSCA